MLQCFNVSIPARKIRPGKNQDNRGLPYGRFRRAAPEADHGIALVDLAPDMQAAVAERRFDGRQLAFRIGINSGPVVAVVIGRKKFYP
ncbi:MAG: hypothetical protein JO227_11860 [Acetobacteraceae bacterium]|nr:hypothetical protein [Acetobacteraceae bacterium]